MAKSAVDTLLALLDHSVGNASAAQIEALLDAPNLLQVLRGEGMTDDEVRARLTEKTTPGELLLELFDKGRSAEELMARLPPDTLAKQAAANAEKKAAGANRTKSAPSRGAERTQRGGARSSGDDAPMTAKVGLVFVALGLVPVILALKIPPLLLAMAVAGPLVVLGVGAALGGVGGWLLGADRPRRIVWALVGLFSTPLGIATAAAYGRYIVSETSRESMFTMELVAAYSVGLLPAALGWGLLRLVERKPKPN